MNELFKDKCNLDGPTFIYTKSVARHPVVIAAIMILLGLGFAAQVPNHPPNFNISKKGDH